MVNVMRTTPLVLSVGLFVWMSAVGAQAQAPSGGSLVNRRVTVRLLTTDRVGVPDDTKKLRDVLPLLKRLRYKTIHLLSTRTVSLKSGLKVPLDKALGLLVRDVQGNQLTVEVHSTTKPGQPPVRLLGTRLRLEPKKPVILSCTVKGGGSFIIVLNLM